MPLTPDDKPAHSRYSYLATGARLDRGRQEWIGEGRNRLRGMQHVVGKKGEAVIQQDTVIKGEISNCDYIEVYGYIEGELSSSRIMVREGGKVFGTLRADNAEIQGIAQGEIYVNRLIKIGSTGNVNGDVQYGQIAMDLGGELSAKLRNVPPEIKGDLELHVSRGKAVRITLVDLNAVDPDDDAKDLSFTVSNANGGFIAHQRAPTTPITNFTQADLENGAVAFVHDGGNGTDAGFDVQVVDAKGATSGAPKSVNVVVQN